MCISKPVKQEVNCTVDWIFSHDLDAEMAKEEQAASSAPAAAAAAPAAAEPGCPDGTKYKLVRSVEILSYGLA